MPERPSYWFPARQYGWGWGPPVTWQGWVAFVCWAVAAGAVAAVLHIHRHTWLWWGYLVGIFAALALLCYLKGEPPKWRWGEPDE